MENSRVAFITGAGNGIGRAIALRLAKDGFNIAVNDVNEEQIQNVAQEIEDNGSKCICLCGDVSNREKVFEMVDQVVEQFGTLDVMVANAGIVQVKTMLEITEHDLEEIFKVNVFGVFYCMQAAAKQMMKQKSGKIINASSTSGKRGLEFLSSYAGTKFSVTGITQSAARELAPYGITVNAYCPGIVGTNMWQEIDEKMSQYLGTAKGEVLKERVSSIPLGRIENPVDVANFVSFLASDDSSYMTGQSVVIDGGLVFS